MCQLAACIEVFGERQDVRERLLQRSVIVCLHILTCPSSFFHADLKPANVLIKGLEIKLTDFGLSHTIAINTMRQDAHGLMGAAAGASSTGTVLWSAPELLEAWSEGTDAPHTPAGQLRTLHAVQHQPVCVSWWMTYTCNIHM